MKWVTSTKLFFIFSCATPPKSQVVERETEEREMDRVFSMDEIDQFWSPHHHPVRLGDSDDPASSSSSAATPQPKIMGMNRSSSEWAFQRFLQEASVSAPDRTATTALQSSSSSTHTPQNDDVVEIKGSQDFIGAGVNANQPPPKIAAAGAPPPNISPDSEEYQAFLKSRLELACAAVALTRVSFFSVINFSVFF